MTVQPQSPATQKSVRPLGWLNFFLADIQTGVGPFLAAYLAANHWNARDVGFMLTGGGLVTVVLSPFAGAIVDASRNKRLLVAVGTLALALGAVLVACGSRIALIASAQLLIGGAGPFLMPAVAAITLGIVGKRGFDRQFGKNQAFNSAGNVFSALLLAGVSWIFGLRGIFLATAALALPVWIVLGRINAKDIDNDVARGGKDAATAAAPSHSDRLQLICRNRTLLLFFVCAFLFHLANAAMLPQLGEMLAKGNERAAAPFMSACIIVTQVVIACSAAWVGRTAGSIGRKPLLLIGFGVLPLRGVLYAVTHLTGALIAVQILDGVANAIFGVVSILVIADEMRGTRHFNFAQGVLATCVGLGAALSNSLGGLLIHHFNYAVSFLGLGAVAALAFALLWVTVPETLESKAPQPA